MTIGQSRMFAWFIAAALLIQFPGYGPAFASDPATPEVTIQLPFLVDRPFNSIVDCDNPLSDSVAIRDTMQRIMDSGLGQSTKTGALIVTPSPQWGNVQIDGLDWIQDGAVVESPALPSQFQVSDEEFNGMVGVLTERKSCLATKNPGLRYTPFTEAGIEQEMRWQVDRLYAYIPMFEAEIVGDFEFTSVEAEYWPAIDSIESIVKLPDGRIAAFVQPMPAIPSATLIGPTKIVVASLVGTGWKIDWTYYASYELLP